MKPFAFRTLDMPQRVFNYRHSIAQRIIENVFGICTARFRILRKPMEMEPEKCKGVVLAVCALHNFLMNRKTIYASTTDFDSDIDGNYRQGNWRNELGENGGLQSIGSSAHVERSIKSTNDVRERFKNYFISDGEVEWQYDIWTLEPKLNN